MSQPWTPEPYQIRAVEFLCAHPDAALFAKPGLRKTSCTLAALSLLFEEGAVTSALVVAPLRPIYKVWPSEVTKWLDFNHISYVILHGKNKAADLKKKVQVYIINYEGLKWLAGQGVPKHIDALVVDESTKVKNHKTLRAEILQAIAGRMKRNVILTGTPRPNHLIDLFSQVRLLDGGERLGKFITHFRRQYFDEEPQRGGFSLWTPMEGAYEAIMEKISDICMVLDYKGNLEMPPLYENVINVDLPDSVRDDYETFASEFILSKAKGDITAPNAAIVGMKLRQIVGGGVYAEKISNGTALLGDAPKSSTTVEFETNKLEALRDLIEEQAGEPLLVAVGFLHEVERIRAFLGDEFGPLPYLGGGVSTKRSNEIIDEWNEGKVAVLLAHPTSVAHGLNLQAGGSSVCWYCLSWNAEEFEQFNGRVWRSGQTKPVTIHYIICEGTIEERVLAVLRKKIAEQAKMFTALEGPAGPQIKAAEEAAAMKYITEKPNAKQET